MLIDRLNKEIVKRKSPIVVGLDPRWDLIPDDIRNRNLMAHGESFRAVAESILEFNKGIVDSVIDEAFIFKPQIAFYEQYGMEGMEAYQKTCEYIKAMNGVVIGDIKRGDIGSTSEAYARAFLGKTVIGNTTYRAFESDFVTVNPYLGEDCINPFIQEVDQEDKGIFVLVKTSNPSSGQLQDLYIGNTRVYERISEWVNGWGTGRIGESGYSPIGAVVGATYPEELKNLRQKMPNALFLVPGYGAQGGGAEDIIEAFDNQGLGALINNSRGILYAYMKTGKDYKKAANEAVVEMKTSIEMALNRKFK